MILSFRVIASIVTGQTTNVIFGTDFGGTGVNDDYAGSFGYAYAGPPAEASITAQPGAGNLQWPGQKTSAK